MSDPEPQSKSGLPPKLSWILAIGFLALLGYQVFTGVVFQEIGFGPLKIKLGIRTPQPSESATPIATREFLVGKWQTAKVGGGIKGDLSLIYRLQFYRDGSWSGDEKLVENQKILLNPPGQGQWSFTALDNYRFHLDVTVQGGGEFHPYEYISGDFGIRDHDHIHNIENDYTMERVPQ